MKILIFSLIFTPLIQASQGVPTGAAASAAADVKTTAAADAWAAAGTSAPSVPSSAADVKVAAASSKKDVLARNALEHYTEIQKIMSRLKGEQGRGRDLLKAKTEQPDNQELRQKYAAFLAAATWDYPITMCMQIREDTLFSQLHEPGLASIKYNNPTIQLTIYGSLAQATAMLVGLYLDIETALRPSADVRNLGQEAAINAAIMPCVFPPNVQEKMSEYLCETDWKTVDQAIADGMGDEKAPFPAPLAHIIGNFAYHPTVEEVFDRLTTAEKVAYWELQRKSRNGVVEALQRMYPQLSSHYSNILRQNLGAYTEFVAGYESLAAYRCDKLSVYHNSGTVIPAGVATPSCTLCGALYKVVAPQLFLKNYCHLWGPLLHRNTCIALQKIYQSYPRLESQPLFPIQVMGQIENKFIETVPFLMDYLAYIISKIDSVPVPEDHELYRRSVRYIAFMQRLYLIEACATTYPDFGLYCQDPVAWTERVNAYSRTKLGEKYNRKRHEIPLPPGFNKDANAAAAAIAAGKK